MKDNLSFGDAIVALKEGKMCRREGWAEAGLFVFRQVPSLIDPEIIPRMTSLPPAVKLEMEKRGRPLQYLNQFAIVKQDNSIHGWVPSAGDVLANDWIILNS